jgi:pyruvate/2-oxoglutarate dehydrogenase complex dihydrolipoamide dehydrogenase (E3) component
VILDELLTEVQKTLIRVSTSLKEDDLPPLNRITLKLKSALVTKADGKGAFTHTAYNDFEIVAANVLDNDPRRVSDRIVCYGLYIDPPLGRAGMTEAQVKQSGRKALIGKRPMANIGRAIEKGESQGFMKILVDAKSKEILGAAILGVGGDEAVHSILDIMYAKQPYTVIQRAMHIHPTVSELIPTILAELKPLE